MADRVVLVDVGALGGLQAEWMPYLGALMPIVFEPNPEHAAELRPEIEGTLGGRVIEEALGAVEGRHTLNVTRAISCSSLLLPDHETLSMFSVEGGFEITGSRLIQCSRYDTLAAQRGLPTPDIIKIDVQGFEYEVLRGFGDMLAGCVAIELEAHLYPLYQGQKLLHDYVEMLRPYGLMLRQLNQSDHFDGYGVEYDARFTTAPNLIDALPPAKRHAFDLAEAAWGLPSRRRKFDAAALIGKFAS